MFCGFLFFSKLILYYISIFIALDFSFGVYVR